MRIFVYILVSLTIFSCSMGTSFRYNEIRSFKGALIPELSDEPILIENLSINLIEKEKNKETLNLPLNLLNYSPKSYKVGPGDVYLFMCMVKQRLSAALARGCSFLKNS